MSPRLMKRSISADLRATLDGIDGYVCTAVIATGADDPKYALALIEDDLWHIAKLLGNALALLTALDETPV